MARSKEYAAKKPPADQQQPPAETMLENLPPRYTDGNKPKGLQAKINEITARINVGKTGWNDHHKYHFTPIDDIMDHLKLLLTELGLNVHPETGVVATTKDGKERFVEVTMKYTLIDVDSGEQLTTTAYGHGSDYGDKALYKALSGAYKYWAKQTFAIGGDSIEPETTALDTNKPEETPATRRDTVKAAIRDAVYAAGYKEGTPAAKDAMIGAMHQLCDKFDLRDLNDLSPDEVNRLLKAIDTPKFVTKQTKKTKPEPEKQKVPGLTDDQQERFRTFYTNHLTDSFPDATPDMQTELATDLLTFVLEKLKVSRIEDIPQNEISNAENAVFQWIRENKE